MQLCHPGRQSPLGAGERGLLTSTIAPSPIPLDIGDGILATLVRMLVFATPREMTVADIETVTRQFVDAAHLMADAGFSGIELHGAHGYLIGKFYFTECPWSDTSADNMFNRPIPLPQGMSSSFQEQAKPTVTTRNDLMNTN